MLGAMGHRESLLTFNGADLVRAMLGTTRRQSGVVSLQRGNARTGCVGEVSRRREITSYSYSSASSSFCNVLTAWRIGCGEI
jgi:hypothetical protein